MVLFSQENLSNHKGHILHTCPDCLLWTDTFRNGDATGRYIMQFSKSSSHPNLIFFNVHELTSTSSASLFPNISNCTCVDFFFSLFILARTGKMDSKDVDIFKKQVECLNFPENYHSYDGKTGQCLNLLLSSSHSIKAWIYMVESLLIATPWLQAHFPWKT